MRVKRISYGILPALPRECKHTQLLLLSPPALTPPALPGARLLLHSNGGQEQVTLDGRKEGRWGEEYKKYIYNPTNPTPTPERESTGDLQREDGFQGEAV
ncbi:hypothetical protein FKM82_022748 [Ascaphus truei]